MLYRDYPSSAEAATVANPIHFVEDGPQPVSGAQKVAVNRVQLLGTVNGTVGRRDSLGKYLPAKNMFGFGVLAAVNILFYVFDIQRVEDA